MSLIWSRIDLDFYETLQKPATDKQVKLLSRAFVLSQTSVCHQRVAAIITQNNKIVCEAINNYKTHPKQKHWAFKDATWKKILNNYLHAELACIIQTKNIEFNKTTTLYIARTCLAKNPSVVSSFPCRVCLPAIMHAKITKLVCYNTNKEAVEIDLGK